MSANVFYIIIIEKMIGLIHGPRKPKVWGKPSYSRANYGDILLAYDIFQAIFIKEIIFVPNLKKNYQKVRFLECRYTNYI